jgi:aldose 1-epimerase
MSPRFAATDGVMLAAVASRNASRPDLPHFATIDELLRDGPPIDAVALCTPPQVRRAQAAAAIEAGKHVMLEKPPGASVRELEPLIRAAARAGRTLFATGHSRFAPAVEPARHWLAARRIRSVSINWKEDVRVWHPGQSWIWQPGGLGVFDPGINALSILTRILPQPLFVTAAELSFPANREAPIAARLSLADAEGLPILAEFGFRQTGPQRWDILIETDGGPLTLSSGGARLVAGGEVLVDAAEAEYRGLYRRFVELTATGASDVDLTPHRRCLPAWSAPDRRTVRRLTMVDTASTVARDVFGVLPDGRTVERVTLRGSNGFEARIITYGAVLQALLAPDAEGRCDDVVLGYDDLDGYLDKRRFFGATVGRYANRIANARFLLDGETVQLAANNGSHALHGGLEGFDRQLWQVTGLEAGAQPRVMLRHVSAHGEEGYPGWLDVSVTYCVTGPTELSLSFEARTDRPTIVNLTNHSFFNLEGSASGSDILGHRLTTVADRFLAIDPDAIPLPESPRPVAGTPFDFRSASTVGARIRDADVQLQNGKGYDHNFCLDHGRDLRLAARLEAPRSGRVLELLTDQPGLQVYSGNYLDGSIRGKQGWLYRQSDAICLEPQIWPDAPNRADFPSARLAPDGVYRHQSVYRFASAGVMR